MQLLQEKASIKEMIKNDASFGERSYHIQKAAALTQGLDNEGLLNLYQDIIDDIKAYPNKAEYEAVIKSRLSSDYITRLEELKIKYMTQEEAQQQRAYKEQEMLEKYNEMTEGFEDMAINEILKEGKTEINLIDNFEASLLQMDKVIYKDYYKKKTKEEFKSKLQGENKETEAS